MDNFSTGSPDSTRLHAENPNFAFVHHDITEVLSGSAEVVAASDAEPFTHICNLASPASPLAYMRLPIETLRAGSIGVMNLLEFSLSCRARFLHASTSEIYGDPETHPQRETYWGRVNPIGPRSMYDESKRFAEASCTAYSRERGADVRLARIFNTYGPRLTWQDGRVISSFISQALRNDPLTILGDGSQTRSFCFVTDEIAGIVALLDSDVLGPVNIGNPEESTILELAHLVCELTGSKSELVFRPFRQDDPMKRQPDISRASSLLGWNPKVDLREGLTHTIEWFRTLPEFG